ncbi:MAG: ABC transporter permease [Actinomycetota bacterium]
MPEAETGSTHGAGGTVHDRDLIQEAPVSPTELDVVVAIEPVVDEPVDTAAEVERAATKRLGIMGWLAVGWLALVAIMVVAPGIFPIPDLDERSVEALRAREFGPSSGHPLGIDGSGYDMMAKVVHGARASMIVSVGAVTFGLVIGGFLGLVAGYFRGRLDTVLTSLFNVMLAFPQLILALTLVTVFANQQGVGYARRVGIVTLAIGIVSVPILGRITRANTLAWAQREFVLAAKVIGTKTSRIMFREVLPNVLPAMFSIVLLGVGVAIVVEGGLALLGVGVPPGIDSPSWGNLIASLRSQLFFGRPWGVFAPSAAVFFTVLSLNYLGDVVRARFDVRESVL